MEIPNGSVSKKGIIQPNLSDILATLSINNLSEQEKENYEIKKAIINIKGFADMKMLTEKSLLKTELREHGNISKKRQEILAGWTNIPEEKNTIINKKTIKEVILPKLEETYTELRNKGGTPEQKEILEECYKNGLYFINAILQKKICENFRLRKCAQIGRGERFLFTTNENKDKYIILEVKKITEKFKKDFKAGLEVQKTNADIHIFDDQNFLVRRHIDDGTDITKMSDILLQGKKLLDYYLADKHIKYITSCSWLFDDKFNEFWMKERVKEGKKDIPNRIKVREELKYYGGKLPDENIKESIENDIIPGVENSMTRAIKKYISEGNVLKEGGGYIDLEKLEKRKIGNGKIPDILDIGFKTDEAKLRKIELPVEEIAISELENNMDIPYREKEGTDDWNLTPRMCLENFEKEIWHAKKVLESDLAYPIELYFHKGQWIILDGVHRFTKAVYLGHTTIKVRKVPENIAQKTKRTGKKYKEWKGQNT